jgi:hypothetical protein
MARGKRTPEETKAYIQEIALLDTELSTHDIEDKLKWTEYECSHDTISRVLTELRQLATTEKWKKQLQRLQGIVDNIEDITTTVISKIKDKEDLTTRDVKDLTDISKTNWERLRMLEWKPTGSLEITDKRAIESLNQLL